LWYGPKPQSPIPNPHKKKELFNYNFYKSKIFNINFEYNNLK